VKKPSLLIVSPARAAANNGNWHTAARWAGFLKDDYATQFSLDWTPSDASPEVMIALHARRSANAIAAFAKAHPERPLVLALTGTDVYRDIHEDAAAQESLKLASAFITLQDQAALELPEALRKKAHVIYQSAAALKARVKPARFSAIMVGHLRDEKDPLTYLRAAGRLKDAPLRLSIIGNPLDAELGKAALEAEEALGHFSFKGGLPRAQTRQAIARASVLVICSKMEGGANVIVEALTAGTPVLASRISGNIGMLGQDYAGYFDYQDDAELARLLAELASTPSTYARLSAQCAKRAKLFAPDTEKNKLLALIHSLRAHS
jgi:putative glycosyltransferase (TIGR04348 family)